MGTSALFMPENISCGSKGQGSHRVSYGDTACSVTRGGNLRRPCWAALIPCFFRNSREDLGGSAACGHLSRFSRGCRRWWPNVSLASGILETKARTFPYVASLSHVFAWFSSVNTVSIGTQEVNTAPATIHDLHHGSYTICLQSRRSIA